MTPLLTALFTIFSVNIALAQNLIVRDVTFSGSGCNNGTARASLSPDNSSISVLFDAYSVNAGGPTKQLYQVMDCKITVPIEVPAGMTVMLDSLDYRGFASLPPNAQMLFGTRDGFYATNAKHEDPADRVTKIVGQFQDNFILQRKRPVQLWSKCGDRVLLTSYSKLMVRANPQVQETLASIDSADGTLGIKFNIIARRCSSDPLNPAIPPGPGIPVRPMPGTPGWPR